MHEAGSPVRAELSGAAAHRRCIDGSLRGTGPHGTYLMRIQRLLLIGASPKAGSRVGCRRDGLALLRRTNFWQCSVGGGCGRGARRRTIVRPLDVATPIAHQVGILVPPP